MPRILAAIFVVIIAAGIWFMTMGAEAIGRKEITRQLNAAGFTKATIGSLSSGPANTAATDIKLDDTGIDTLKSLSVGKGWFNALFSGDDGDITFVAPDLYRTVDHVNALLPGLMALQRDMMKDLPAGRIIVRDGRISIHTPAGNFQFLFDLVIDPAKEETGKRLLNATLKSTQATLEFASEWRGWIEADGTLLADALIPEIKTHIGPVRLTRGNGWFSLSNAGKYPALSGQIESGAASLSTLPLQNFSLTLDASRDAVTILSRAQASGAAQNNIAVDVTLDEAQRQIAMTLTADDLPSFFTYLDSAVARPTTALQKSFEGNKRMQLGLNYQLSKRFPGGPYPFDMQGTLDGQEFLSGTFLVYPGTFDMRGSAKMSSSHVSAIASYFKLPAASVSGDYIRLDASLAPFISGVGAGVEHNAGE